MDAGSQLSSKPTAELANTSIKNYIIKHVNPAKQVSLSTPQERLKSRDAVDLRLSSVLPNDKDRFQ